MNCFQTRTVFRGEQRRVESSLCSPCPGGGVLPGHVAKAQLRVTVPRTQAGGAGRQRERGRCFSRDWNVVKEVLNTDWLIPSMDTPIKGNFVASYPVWDSFFTPGKDVKC